MRRTLASPLRVWKVLILAGMVLWLAGCQDAATPTGEGASGDILVTGSIGDASNLLPLLAADKTSHDVASSVYNGLVKYDKNINIIGDLARSWDISPDGLTITFRLRRDVRWHDGAPFTAEDVLFTYRLTIDPQTPTAYAGDFLRVKTARVIDNHTFQVTYDRPFAPALMSWGSAILPRHLLEGRKITETPLARRPVGTGPFKFQEWVGAEKIVLVANPDYFLGRPPLAAVIMRVIPDMATMFLQLRSGGVDLMHLTPLQFSRQTDTPAFRREFNKFRYPSFSYTYLGFNLALPNFADKRVRQAIAHAINKREIVDGVLLGLGEEATGPYPRSSWAYNPRVKRYDYDPQRAKELLAQAGWRDTDGDGVVDKNGKPFVMEILTNQGNDMRAKTAEIIQRRLLEVGIVVKIRVVEWAAFIKDFIGKRRFDAVLLGWSVSYDPDSYDVWHSSKTGPAELNFISFKNAEVDALLEAGRCTFDKKVRQRCYGRFQEILAEEVPYVFLYVPDDLVAVQSRFQGIIPAKLGITHNLHEWSVPALRQRYTMER